MHKIRFLTLWYRKERLQNVHLIKDVGCIPYMLYKNYGYDSTIAFQKKGGYPYAEKEVKGLKIDFIKKITDSEFLNSLLYIVNNARKFDVLNLYHYGLKSFIIGFCYKLVNQKGILYLRLDFDAVNIQNIKKMRYIKRKVHEVIVWLMLHDRAIVSGETKKVCRELKNLSFPQIKYITNGFYFEDRKKIEFSSKKNEILFVGRVGSKQKNTETLLKGFHEAYKKLPGWNLILAGPVEEKESDFQKYLNLFFQENPKIIDRIQITGNIEDRSVLSNYYESAKIFCLTSLYESFGIVMAEAMGRGDYIIATDIPSAREVTQNGKYGALFPIGDYKKLSELMVSLGHDESVLAENCAAAQNYIYENYNWENICGRLDSFIQKERRKIYK